MEEVRPWAIIRAVAPMKLRVDCMRAATITRPIWLTEEYAMRDFRSVWRKQIELVIIIPHKDRTMNG